MMLEREMAEATERIEEHNTTLQEHEQELAKDVKRRRQELEARHAKALLELETEWDAMLREQSRLRTSMEQSAQTHAQLHSSEVASKMHRMQLQQAHRRAECEKMETAAMAHEDCLGHLLARSHLSAVQGDSALPESTTAAASQPSNDAREREVRVCVAVCIAACIAACIVVCSSQCHVWYD